MIVIPTQLAALHLTIASLAPYIVIAVCKLQITFTGFILHLAFAVCILYIAFAVYILHIAIAAYTLAIPDSTLYIAFTVLHLTTS